MTAGDSLQGPERCFVIPLWMSLNTVHLQAETELGDRCNSLHHAYSMDAERPKLGDLPATATR